jgi:hypothetical protein
LVAQLKGYSVPKRKHLSIQLQRIQRAESVIDGLDQRLMRILDEATCSKKVRRKLADHVDDLNTAMSEALENDKLFDCKNKNRYFRYK